MSGRLGWLVVSSWLVACSGAGPGQPDAGQPAETSSFTFDCFEATSGRFVVHPEDPSWLLALGVSQDPVALLSTDSGKTWRRTRYRSLRLPVVFEDGLVVTTGASDAEVLVFQDLFAEPLVVPLDTLGGTGAPLGSAYATLPSGTRLALTPLRHLVRSDDGGQTWKGTQRSFVAPIADTTVTLRASTPNAVWVSTQSGAVQVSSNGGKSFTPALFPRAAGFVDERGPVFELALGEQGRVAVIKAHQEDGRPHLFVSRSDGAFWQSWFRGLDHIATGVTLGPALDELWLIERTATSQQPRLWRSTNLGSSFHQPVMRSAGLDLEALEFFDFFPGTGIATGLVPYDGERLRFFPQRAHAFGTTRPVCTQTSGPGQFWTRAKAGTVDATGVVELFAHVTPDLVSVDGLAPGTSVGQVFIGGPGATVSSRGAGPKLSFVASGTFDFTKGLAVDPTDGSLVLLVRPVGAGPTSDVYRQLGPGFDVIWLDPATLAVRKRLTIDRLTDFTEPGNPRYFAYAEGLVVLADGTVMVDSQGGFFKLDNETNMYAAHRRNTRFRHRAAGSTEWRPGLGHFAVRLDSTPIDLALCNAPTRCLPYDGAPVAWDFGNAHLYVLDGVDGKVRSLDVLTDGATWQVVAEGFLHPTALWVDRTRTDDVLWVADSDLYRVTPRPGQVGAPPPLVPLAEGDLP